MEPRFLAAMVLAEYTLFNKPWRPWSWRPNDINVPCLLLICIVLVGSQLAVRATGGVMRAERGQSAPSCHGILLQPCLPQDGLLHCISKSMCSCQQTSPCVVFVTDDELLRWLFD